MFNLRLFGTKKVAEYGMARLSRSSMMRFSTQAKAEATEAVQPKVTPQAVEENANEVFKDTIVLIQKPGYTTRVAVPPSYDPANMPSTKEMYFGGFGQTLKCESILKRRTLQQLIISLSMGIAAGYLYADMFRLRFKWYDLIQWESSEVVKDAHAYYEKQGIPNNSNVV